MSVNLVKTGSLVCQLISDQDIDLGDVVLGQKTFRQWQNFRLEKARLSNKSSKVFLRDDVWLSKIAYEQLLSGSGVLQVDGVTVASLSEEAFSPEVEVNTFEDESSLIVEYPWQLISCLEELFQSGDIKDAIEGSFSPRAEADGVLQLGEGSQVLPGVYIEGNVTIGKNCKIGPNCYIRGNTSVGDNCHIGQSVEIKNSLIMNGTNVGHLSYVGDSILCEGVNFGAGTSTSNLRHDGADQQCLYNGEFVNTGRRKLGAIVGPRVHTGINTSIYPGRFLAIGTSTLPGEIVRKNKF